MMWSDYGIISKDIIRAGVRMGDHTMSRSDWYNIRKILYALECAWVTIPCHEVIGIISEDIIRAGVRME